MTQAIVKALLQEEDDRFARQGWKVVFTVENCLAGSLTEGLKFTILKFLPANDTAVIPPIDQGIIQSLKMYYLRQLFH